MIFPGLTIKEVAVYDANDLGLDDVMLIATDTKSNDVAIGVLMENPPE